MDHVTTCRDVLIEIVEAWCGRRLPNPRHQTDSTRFGVKAGQRRVYRAGPGFPRTQRVTK